ncbi:sulfotransferase family protein [Nocardioides sp.]|uniref:sulfotransferase family protein n=1 Tax=Nocardioides sp. TaxID=35761 RepID=UPI002B274254|nr:sulfotransferase family protein [Nocardioides sp.]
MDEPRSTAPEDFDPTLLSSSPDERLKLTEPGRKALRRLDKISARSGRLSTRAYNLTISHEHRLIWFRVAKVGTRTVLDHLERSGVTLDVKHAMRLRYPVEAFDDYFKFAFVRHPLDRFVSAWRDKVVDHNYWGFEPDQLARMQRLEAFAEWVATRDLTDLTTCDQHLALQVRAIDLTQVDHVGRMETFADDFAVVCRRLGLPEVAPERRNASTAVPPDEVTDEVRERVAELYRLDFQVLGYPTG